MEETTILTWNERAVLKGILCGYSFEELSDLFDADIKEVKAAYKSAWYKLGINEIGLGDFSESSSEHTSMDPYFWKE